MARPKMYGMQATIRPSSWRGAGPQRKKTHPLTREQVKPNPVAAIKAAKKEEGRE